ncbi:hypothetical protein NXY60_20865, partial [Escherichia coli]|nr:hypothetical protein [Escherichia coli]
WRRLLENSLSAKVSCWLIRLLILGSGYNTMISHLGLIRTFPNAGALKAGGMVASMDQGGSPITWLLIQVFSPQNIPGFIIIGAIYLTGIFMTWRRARGFIKQEKVVLAE